MFASWTPKRGASLLGPDTLFCPDVVKRATLLNSMTTTFPVFACERLDVLKSPKSMRSLRDCHNVLRSGGLGEGFGTKMTCMSAAFPLLAAIATLNKHCMFMDETNSQMFLTPNVVLVPLMPPNMKEATPMLAVVAIKDIAKGKPLTAEQDPLMIAMAALDIAVTGRVDSIQNKEWLYLMKNVIATSLALVSVTFTGQKLRTMRRRVGCKSLSTMELLSNAFLHDGASHIVHEDYVDSMRPDVLQGLFDEWTVNDVLSCFSCTDGELCATVVLTRKCFPDSRDACTWTAESTGAAMKCIVSLVRTFYVGAVAATATHSDNFVLCKPQALIERGIMKEDCVDFVHTLERYGTLRHLDIRNVGPVPNALVYLCFMLGDEQYRTDFIASVDDECRAAVLSKDFFILMTATLTRVSVAYQKRPLTFLALLNARFDEMVDKVRDVYGQEHNEVIRSATVQIRRDMEATAEVVQELMMHKCWPKTENLLLRVTRITNKDPFTMKATSEFVNSDVFADHAGLRL
jgi:hypothetical protein